MNIPLSLRLVTRSLLIVIIVLIALHIVLQFLHLNTSVPMFAAIPDRFNLDQEVSIPTWFSQLQLFFAAILLALISYIYKLRHDRDWRYWVLLSLVFVYLSIDEGAELHELMARPLREIFGIQVYVDTLSNAWVIVAVPVLLIFLAIIYKFLMRLPRRTFMLFAIAGAVFIFGAVIAELFGTGKGGFSYSLMVALEEGCEMLGVWIFIYALVDYLSAHESNLAIKLK